MRGWGWGGCSLIGVCADVCLFVGVCVGRCAHECAFLVLCVSVCVCVRAPVGCLRVVGVCGWSGK